MSEIQYLNPMLPQPYYVDATTRGAPVGAWYWRSAYWEEDEPPGGSLVLSRCPYGIVGEAFKVQGGWHRIVRVSVQKIPGAEQLWYWSIECVFEPFAGLSEEASQMTQEGLNKRINR